jgi:HEAT repeat protein
VVELLHRAGTPGAYALYSVRIKATSMAARRRFVANLQSYGVVALPMIRAALARIESRRNSGVGAHLFLDIIAASPRVLDDEAGTIVARYLEGSAEPVTCAAIEALVSFWRARAAPELLGLIGAESERVCIAAVRGLVAIGAVGEHVAPRLAHLSRTNPSPAVRAAATEALAGTQ